MKILSNKKYNELLLKPLQGCFSQVNDDQLLRENGLLYAENKRLKNIINELEKTLDENVELTYVHYGKRQYNKTLTEGGLLFRDYIKSKLQELKGSDK